MLTPTATPTPSQVPKGPERSPSFLWPCCGLLLGLFHLQFVPLLSHTLKALPRSPEVWAQARPPLQLQFGPLPSPRLGPCLLVSEKPSSRLNSASHCVVDLTDPCILFPEKLKTKTCEVQMKPSKPTMDRELCNSPA